MHELSAKCWNKSCSFATTLILHIKMCGHVSILWTIHRNRNPNHKEVKHPTILQDQLKMVMQMWCCRRLQPQCITSHPKKRNLSQVERGNRLSFYHIDKKVCFGKFCSSASSIHGSFIVK